MMPPVNALHDLLVPLLSVSFVDFLYSERFTKALGSAAAAAAPMYGLTIEEVLDEFRRFVALKVLIADTNASRISPTPLSR